MPTKPTTPRNVTLALTDVSIIEGEFDRIGAHKISAHAWEAVAELKKILKQGDGRGFRLDPTERDLAAKEAKSKRAAKKAFRARKSDPKRSTARKVAAKAARKAAKKAGKK